jgi:hypothetical protein
MGRTAGINILFSPRCPFFARDRPARQESHGAGLSSPVYREGREKTLLARKKIIGKGHLLVFMQQAL